MGIQHAILKVKIRSKTMPRKATPTGRKRESRLSIRADAEVKKILTQAARVRHTKVSQFVLQASLDAAHTVLANQTEFRLPPAQWEAFCERLDAPAKVIPALKDLFREPEPAG
jgi:uncharacterized protein (DUF1778 family)